jgi:outer membrane protein TolC
MLAFATSAIAQDAQAPDRSNGGPTLTLSQAHRRALEHNPQIHNLQETLYQARATTWKAWTLLAPTLRATGNITRNKTESKISMPDLTGAVDPVTGAPVMNDIVLQSLWDYGFGFVANIALFNPRSIPLLKNAYENVDFTRYYTTHQKNDLLFAVTTTFYQVQSSKEAVRVAQENLKTAEEFQRLSRERVKVGQATRLDELRADSDVMAAQKDLKNAEDSVRLAKTALAYLIGLDGPYSISAPGEVEPVSGELDALTKKALHDRLDFKASQLNVVMADRNKAATWTKWLPVFDLTYKWDYTKSTGFNGEHDTWMLIFGASWSLFDGGMTIIELAEDGSVLRQAQNNVIQMSLDIRQEVEKAMVNLEKARRNVEFSKQQVELAEETNRLVRRQYELGMGTSLDVVDASATLTRARIALVLEQLGYRLSVLSLNKAVGEYYPQAATGI